MHYREDILLRIFGKGHDMVANNICYHKPCMTSFWVQQIRSGKSSQQKTYDIAFIRLVESLEMTLFQEMVCFLIKSLRDHTELLFKN